MAKPSFSVRSDHDAADGLYYATCWDLQGCHTFGKTRAGAIAAIKEVILDPLQARLSVRAAPAGLRGDLPGGSQIVDIAA